MIKRFPELQGINKGLAVSILLVKSVQILAPDHKRGNPLSVILDPDPVEVAALAQEESPSIDVRGL